jgi:hypothetical protein
VNCLLLLLLLLYCAADVREQVAHDSAEEG